MNCKQIKKLLPLYVSRDLEAERERMVTAHVESCVACSVAAGEYRQSRQWLQDFVPPAFSDDIYTLIRQNVWRQIESESRRRSPWEVIDGWFRPRLTWALAAVVLIAVMVSGIYLIGNRSSVPPRIASTAPATNPPVPDQEPSRAPEERAQVPSGTANEIAKESRVANRRPTPQKTHRNVIADRPDSVVAARSAQSLTADPSSRINTSVQSDESSDHSSENILRMEIQTRNPNIRIIWFSQRDRKSASPNLKGI